MKKYIFSFNKFLIWNLKVNGKENTYQEYLKYHINNDWWTKILNGKEINFKENEHFTSVGSFCISRDWCIEKEV